MAPTTAHPSDRLTADERRAEIVRRCPHRVRGRRVCRDIDELDRRRASASRSRTSSSSSGPSASCSSPPFATGSSGPAWSSRTPPGAAEAEEGPACNVLERDGPRLHGTPCRPGPAPCPAAGLCGLWRRDVRTAVREEFTDLHATVRDLSGASPRNSTSSSRRACSSTSPPRWSSGAIPGVVPGPPARYGGQHGRDRLTIAPAAPFFAA